MDKEYLIKLTNDLYRLTLLFPKKEPLRYKMRELGDNILTNLMSIIEGDTLRYKEIALEIRKDSESLDSFFEIVKDQNWVISDAISEIQDKYQVIKEEIEKFTENLSEESDLKEEVKLKKTAVKPEIKINERQKKIVELLKEKEKMQVGDVQDIFPKITKRTLRRDFDSLMKSGMIKRLGKANLTFYKLSDK